MDAAGLDKEAWDALDVHVARHIGPVTTVFHEIASDLIHLDVYHFRPTAQRPFHVLMSVNMSALAMSVPPETDWPNRAELMVCLPDNWLLNEDDFRDERNYWPVRWLKILARYPHKECTWLGNGHTIATDEPAAPVAEGVDFRGFLFWHPAFLSRGARRFQLPGGREVAFLAIVPLFAAELEFARSVGSDALVARFEVQRISQVVCVGRPNVCA